MSTWTPDQRKQYSSGWYQSSQGQRRRQLSTLQCLPGSLYRYTCLTRHTNLAQPTAITIEFVSLFYILSGTSQVLPAFLLIVAGLGNSMGRTWKAPIYYLNCCQIGSAPVANPTKALSHAGSVSSLPIVLLGEVVMKSWINPFIQSPEILELFFTAINHPAQP
jgi:hypothetical protein